MVYQSTISKPGRSTVSQNNPSTSPKSPQKKSSITRGSIIIVLVLIIIFGALYLIYSYTGISVPLFPQKLSDDQWQAVFLTNGQVYFGKITEMNRKSLVLKDIYYLQVITQPLQRSQEPGFQPVPQQEQRLTLIKLGNELHGPEDEMVINRDHVVLVENLKSNSRVVEAINRYIQEQQSQ